MMKAGGGQMVGVYYAITRQQAQWVYVCSGPDPAQVYQSALDILHGHTAAPEDQPVALPPAVEQSVDNLRVVPAEVARQTYQVQFLAAGTEEHGY